MKITRVAFVNYRKHRNLNLELTGNLIGLTGRNGSGKSRLLMGIRDCLTGDFAPTKEKCVTWGEKSGSVEVEVQISLGRTMTVHRDFPSGKAWMKFSDWPEGTPPITGASKVNDVVLQTLGTEKSILTNIVFVGQREIEALLFDRSGVKARLAQRFFGLDKAQVLEKALGLEQAKVVFDSSDQQIPALNAEISAYRQQIAGYDEELAKLGNLVSDEEIAAVETRWRSATEMTNKEAGLKALDLAAQDLQRQIDEGTAKVAADSAELAKVNVADLDRLYGYHLQVQQQQAQKRSILDGIARMQQVIAAAGAEPISQAEVDKLMEQKNTVDRHRELLASQISQLRNEMHQTIGTPICPRCGQPVDLSHRQRMGDEIEARSAALDEYLNKNLAMLETADTASNARTSWLFRVGNAPHQLEVLQGQLSSLGEVPDIVPQPQQFLEARRQIDNMSATLVAAQASLQVASHKLLMNRQQQQDFRALLQSGSQQEDPQVLVRELETLRARQSAQKQLLGNSGYANQLMQRAIGQMEHARLASIENQVSNQYQRELVRLREVFHPDGAPKVLVSRTVQRLEDGVNRYLDVLETPFRVKAREGLDFDYTFPQGLGDADDLSVGQQVDVAWAFRLAAMQTLGASVGMMTMDEPTAPLDKQTKQHFHLLLDHLRQLAVAGQMQFIVATHDEDLVAFCDQHIQL